jgi:Membrane-fusion protein
VTSLSLSVGEQVDTSTVITISQLSQPYVLDAYLDEADWVVAKVGNKVNVTFDLLPEKAFPGTVTLVYPELDPSFEASLVQINVQLDQSLSQDLPAGTGATVDVLGGEARGVVLVPVSAVHENDGMHYVNIIQNGQNIKRTVEIGLKNDSYAEIKSGLEAGEIVVTK